MSKAKVKYSLWHYISHLTGFYGGKVVSKLDNDGNVWVGFKCSTCGKVEGRYNTGNNG